MSQEMFPSRCSEPETYNQVITFTGAGAGTPTKVYGKGVTVTWVSTGLYTLTFTDNPGNFIGYNGEFQATTMTALKGYTSVLGAFDSTGKIVQVSVFNSTFALADLAALQNLCMFMVFKRAAIAL